MNPDHVRRIQADVKAGHAVPVDEVLPGRYDIIVTRVADMTGRPIPGSAMVPCGVCDELCWISPETMARVAEPVPVCVQCFYGSQP